MQKLTGRRCCRQQAYLDAREGSDFGTSRNYDVLRLHDLLRSIFFNGCNFIATRDFAMACYMRYLSRRPVQRQREKDSATSCYKLRHNTLSCY